MHKRQPRITLTCQNLTTQSKFTSWYSNVFYQYEITIRDKKKESLLRQHAGSERRKEKDHHSKIFKLQAAWESVKQIPGAEIMAGSNLYKRRIQWVYGC